MFATNVGVAEQEASITFFKSSAGKTGGVKMKYRFSSNQIQKTCHKPYSKRSTTFAA